jgi:hypothetical protein
MEDTSNAKVDYKYFFLIISMLLFEVNLRILLGEC